MVFVADGTPLYVTSKKSCLDSASKAHDPTTKSRCSDRLLAVSPTRIAFVTFLLFAIAEMIWALWYNSLSLVGDAASMLVDSMSYALNEMSDMRKPGATPLGIIRLELIAPSISAVALFGGRRRRKSESMLRVDSCDRGHFEVFGCSSSGPRCDAWRRRFGQGGRMRGIVRVGNCFAYSRAFDFFYSSETETSV